MSKPGVSMKIETILVTLALSVALSGCASMFQGTTQSVTIVTTPVAGAQCKLVNSVSAWTVTSPGSAQVHKSKSRLDIHCKKDGYQDASISIRAHLNSLTFLGGPAGVGIDAASGADFKYPVTVTVPMTPIGGSAPLVAPRAGATIPATPPPKPSN